MLKIVNEIEPKATLKYNKNYIGIGIDGAPLNFVAFVPRKNSVTMYIKLTRSKEIDDQLIDADIETLDYVSRWRQYRVKFDAVIEGKKREVLLDLVRQSRESFGR